MKTAFTTSDFIAAYMGDYIKDVLPDGALTRLDEVWKNINKYEATRNAFHNALVNLISRTVAETDNGFENPLGKFEGDLLPYGSTIETIYADVVEAQEFGKDCDQFGKYDQDIKVLFHSEDFQLKYPLTIESRELNKAFLSESGLSELVNAKVQSLYNSKEFTNYDNEKYLFTRDIAGVQVNVYADNAQDKAANLAKGIKKASATFEQPSRAYNQMGAKRTCRKERQVCLIDSSFEAESDVDLLSAAYNLDKLEARGVEFVRVDGFEETGLVAVLFDRDALEWHDTLQLATEAYNAACLRRNMFLHHWGFRSFKLYANCVKFYANKPDAPITVTTAHGTVDDLKVNGVAWDIAKNYTAFANEVIVLPQLDDIVAGGKTYQVTGYTIGGTAYAIGNRVRITGATTIAVVSSEKA